MGAPEGHPPMAPMGTDDRIVGSMGIGGRAVSQANA